MGIKNQRTQRIVYSSRVGGGDDIKSWDFSQGKGTEEKQETQFGEGKRGNGTIPKTLVSRKCTDLRDEKGPVSLLLKKGEGKIDWPDTIDKRTPR